MTDYLLDSWAWMELFHGSPAGGKILELAKNADRLYTTSANLYEVLYRIGQDEGEQAAEEKRAAIMNYAVVQDITVAVALKAVELRKREKLAALDSFTLAAALLLGAKLVTGDSDFKNVKNIVYLGP